VAFSDGVFAITVTLLVLAITPPTDNSDLLHGLLALWPSYLAYAVTFLLALLPVAGVVVTAALNAYYWLPIRGENPRPRAS
jgi:hypothetical protein